MHPPFPSRPAGENRSLMTTGFRMPHVSPTERSPAQPINSHRLAHLGQNEALPFPAYAMPHPENAAVPHFEQLYPTTYASSALPSYFPGANAGHVTVDEVRSFTLSIPLGGDQSQCSLLSPMSAVIERPGQKAEKKSRDKLTRGFREVRNTLQRVGQDIGPKADNLFQIVAVVKKLLKRIKELEDHVANLQMRLGEQEQGILINTVGPFQYPANAQAGPSNYATDHVNQNYEG